MLTSRLLGNKTTPLPVRALDLHKGFRSGSHDNDLALLELAGPLSFGPALIQLCLPTKDFSENILMHSGRRGVVENRDLGYMTLDQCRRQLNVSHPLSNKMFCMRRHKEPGPRRTTGPLGNHNGTRRNPHGHAGNQTGGHGRLNQNHSSWNAGSRARSEVRGGACGGPLPGSPVATVERGTAFLTGLMISSSAGCSGGGLVFTKVSRHLTWIDLRVKAAEDHMTPQVSQYPEKR